MATATAPPTDRPNTVKVSDAGPSRKKIHIEVPSATVDETLTGQMDTLVSEAEIKGFRKGRAPRRLVEKVFGSSVRKQAKEQLVAQAYAKAVEDHKLRVLGQIAGTVEDAVCEAGKPLVFEVEVEVPPEFDLPNLDGLDIKKPQLTVSEDMVTKEIEKFCIQEGRLEERPAAEPGDYLTGHARMEGAKSGKVYFESDGIVVQVPPKDKGAKGMIVGLVVDDLTKQLGLPKAGDEVVITTTGPDSHENEEVRGQPIKVTYKPSRVDRIIAADEAELATRLGMSGPEQLKEIVRDRLQQRVLVEQQTVMRQQVGRFLIDNVKMDLPERTTATQAARNLERKRLELMYRGVDALAIEEHLAELRTASGKSAQAELKVFFILDKAAEKLGIKVSEQEINGRIAQIAMERNERPERLRQQLIQSNQVGSVFQQIREHKTMDAILAKAKVTEMSAEDFNKAMKDMVKKN